MSAVNAMALFRVKSFSTVHAHQTLRKVGGGNVFSQSCLIVRRIAANIAALVASTLFVCKPVDVKRAAALQRFAANLTREAAFLLVHRDLVVIQIALSAVGFVA